jgi:two-component system cell cycle sensor histidine kinase/response regulator CckA
MNTAAEEATILIVEDDEALRKLVATVLSKAGYRVLAAEDAIEAAELLTSEECEIDLIIADIILPGLSGPELAREVLEQHPNVKVIFVSGSQAESVLETTDLVPNERFLPKPYTPDTILDIVRDVLA